MKDIFGAPSGVPDDRLWPLSGHSGQPNHRFEPLTELATQVAIGIASSVPGGVSLDEQRR